eukprot:2064124-Pleurochrysis_carterae.AAC.2
MANPGAWMRKRRVRSGRGGAGSRPGGNVTACSLATRNDAQLRAHGPNASVERMDNARWHGMAVSSRLQGQREKRDLPIYGNGSLPRAKGSPVSLSSMRPCICANTYAQMRAAQPCVQIHLAFTLTPAHSHHSHIRHAPRALEPTDTPFRLLIRPVAHTHVQVLAKACNFIRAAQE